MLKVDVITRYTLFVTVLLASTVVEHCSGQRNPPRSQRVGTRTLNPTNNQRSIQFGSRDNPVYRITNSRQRHRPTLTNRNNIGINNQNRFYVTNQQSNNFNGRRFTSPQTNFRQQNSLNGVRSQRGARIRSNTLTNTVGSDYDTQNGVTLNSFRPNSFHRGQQRNRNSINQNQSLSSRRRRTNNLSVTENRRPRNNAGPGSNLQRTFQNSRFTGARNRFDRRSFSGTPRNFVRGVTMGESSFQVNPYESLSVPFRRYQLQQRRMNRFNRYNFYRNNYIPEATSLPSGLEFMGRSYEAKKFLSARQNENRGSTSRRPSRRTPGIKARALGNILGISSQTITDIASTPTVFQRTKETLEQIRQQPQSPAIDSPGLQVVTRSDNNANAKTQLLTNIGDSLSRLTGGGYYGDNDYGFNGDVEEADTISIRPIRTIIISDSNTFTKLKSDAASTGSLIGAIPPSAIDDNLLSRKTDNVFEHTAFTASPEFGGGSSVSNQESVRVKTVNRQTREGQITAAAVITETNLNLDSEIPHQEPVVRTILRVKKPLTDMGVRVTTLLPEQSNYFDQIFGDTD